MTAQIFFPKGLNSQGNSAPLSDTDLQKMISEISANQIEAIAEKCIAQVMDRLRIDVYNSSPTPEENYSDFNSSLHQRRETYYAHSAFLKYLLPVVQQAITNAFSIPTEVITHGVSLKFTSPDKTGILDNITDPSLALSVKNGMANLMQHFDLSDEYSEHLNFSICLELDKDLTTKSFGPCSIVMPELYFRFIQFFNGETTAFCTSRPKGISLSDIEQDATQSNV